MRHCYTETRQPAVGRRSFKYVESIANEEGLDRDLPVAAELEGDQADQPAYNDAIARALDSATSALLAGQLHYWHHGMAAARAAAKADWNGWFWKPGDELKLEVVLGTGEYRTSKKLLEGRGWVKSRQGLAPSGVHMNAATDYQRYFRISVKWAVPLPDDQSDHTIVRA